jgi:hypothetical protein
VPSSTGPPLATTIPEIKLDIIRFRDISQPPPWGLTSTLLALKAKNYSQKKKSRRRLGPSSSGLKARGHRDIALFATHILTASLKNRTLS